TEAETNAATPTRRICFISVSMPAMNIRRITPIVEKEFTRGSGCTQLRTEGPTSTPTTSCPNTVWMPMRWHSQPTHFAAIRSPAINTSNVVTDMVSNSKPFQERISYTERLGVLTIEH